MTAILPPQNGNQCCNCDFVIDPCTCCDTQSSDSYSESHGYDECPNVGPPCVSSGEPSCANRLIGPINLYSEDFPTACLRTKSPKAAIAYSADDHGYATGQQGQVGCPPPTECVSCGASGIITPFIEARPNNMSRMKVTAFGQNGFFGGPYGLSVTATFYLE